MANEIFITKQADFDQLPEQFENHTTIVIKDCKERITVTRKIKNSSVVARENSSVVARENSSVVARENSSVEAWENSSVEAWENSSVEARGNSSVVAWGNSSVVARENSSVVAWGNSSVVARENSSVVAWENSSVVARGNSSVVAWENSSVVAWENSSVEAWENSSVEARENSSVVARGNSSVEAWENSSVEAWGNSSVVAWENSSVEANFASCVRLVSPDASVALSGFAICFQFANGKIDKQSETATIIKPEYAKGVPGWLEREGVKESKGKVILFKRVSKDLFTQEDTPSRKTLWAIGSTLEHHDWKPEREECGEGKFHACSRTYFCDEFRDIKGDRYIAIEVATEDLYPWESSPSYPHKVAFRKGTVLYECNRLGRKLEN